MIGRRTFLQWGTAAPLLLSGARGATAANATPQNTLVVIDAIHADTDADRLSVVLAAFAQKGLPVTCTIDPGASRRGRLAPDSAISRTLRTQWQRLPGLIQLVPLVRDLGAMTPYFQARAAYEAQTALRRGLWVDPGPKTGAMPIQTIACNLSDAPLAPSGVRASGIRNVLMQPSTSTPVRPEAWDDGVVRMVGGQRVQLNSPGRAFRMAPQQAVERIIYLSADDFSAEPLASLGQSATDFAAQVLRQDGSSWVSPLLASDIQYRDAYDYKRNLGLHFIVRPDASAADFSVLADFRLELIMEGIPSSFGIDTTDDPGAGYWISVEGDRPADVPSSPLDVFAFNEAEAAPATAPTSSTPYGMGVRLAELGDAGVDADSILKVGTVLIRDDAAVSRLSSAPLGSADCVIVVAQEVLRNRPQRSALKRALATVADDGISDVTTLPDYVRRVVPNGPYIGHFRRTQTYRQRAIPAPGPKQGDERARLMEDAKVAWSYFERWTNAKTGLCPATVNFSEGGQRLHEAVTMWDVGSHILALMAAVDLELITPDKFQSSIRSILPNIAGRQSQGRLLPQGWIVTDRFKWGNRNFDGCDAGRLLAALYNLDTHPLVTDRAANIVGSWDLEQIVKDGIIFSVESGELSSTFTSHCAHYAAWAFRIWGIEARSPYEVLQGRSAADGRMALLEVGGKIGPMGAEPLLMEAIELGMSPESAYLADVLFAAQLEEYEKTGRLICVSEGPIDSEPWFIYQGLQFDAPGRVWATDTVEGLAEHRTKAFREKNLAISSKGAYLWAAYKDHPYSHALVARVREKAKSANGFASSINQRTGRPSNTYTDINTNAVILQSIAQILKSFPKSEVTKDG